MRAERAIRFATADCEYGDEMNTIAATLESVHGLSVSGGLQATRAECMGLESPGLTWQIIVRAARKIRSSQPLVANDHDD